MVSSRDGSGRLFLGPGRVGLSGPPLRVGSGSGCKLQNPRVGPGRVGL